MRVATREDGTQTCNATANDNNDSNNNKNDHSNNSNNNSNNNNNNNDSDTNGKQSKTTTTGPRPRVPSRPTERGLVLRCRDGARARAASPRRSAGPPCIDATDCGTVLQYYR